MVSNQNIKIFPILPEALGLFLITPKEHILYKQIAQEIIDNPKDNFQKVWNIIVINAWLKENII